MFQAWIIILDINQVYLLSIPRVEGNIYIHLFILNILLQKKYKKIPTGNPRHQAETNHIIHIQYIKSPKRPSEKPLDIIHIVPETKASY